MSGVETIYLGSAIGTAAASTILIMSSAILLSISAIILVSTVSSNLRDNYTETDYNEDQALIGVIEEAIKERLRKYGLTEEEIDAILDDVSRLENYDHFIDEEEIRDFIENYKRLKKIIKDAKERVEKYENENGINGG